MEDGRNVEEGRKYISEGGRRKDINEGSNVKEAGKEGRTPMKEGRTSMQEER